MLSWIIESTTPQLLQVLVAVRDKWNGTQWLAGRQQPEILRFTEYLNVSRSIEIGMKFEIVIQAVKNISFSVILMDISAFWAFLWCVFRIHIHDSLVHILWPVFYELLQLERRPWSKHGVVSPSRLQKRFVIGEFQLNSPEHCLINYNTIYWNLHWLSSPCHVKGPSRSG